MNISERLKTLRTERKMKKVDVARTANIHPDVYSSWESGRRMPHLSQLEALAKVFKTDYNGLLGTYRSVTDVEKEIQTLKSQWEEEIKKIKWEM